jgi:hypothetical protein
MTVGLSRWQSDANEGHIRADGTGRCRRRTAACVRRSTLASFTFKLIQFALSGNSKVRPGPAAPDSVGNLNLPVDTATLPVPVPTASESGHWHGLPVQ